MDLRDLRYFETIAELGCGTGLVRMLSRDRAMDRQDLLRATVIVAIAPVVVAALAGAPASCSGAM